MKKEDIIFLNQMISSLEESEKKLEREYKKKDHTQFEKIRNSMIQIQKEISEIIER